MHGELLLGLVGERGGGGGGDGDYSRERMECACSEVSSGEEVVYCEMTNRSKVMELWFDHRKFVPYEEWYKPSIKSMLRFLGFHLLQRR